MDVTGTSHRRTPTPVSLGLWAAVGAAFALLATYWDDSWHTDKGRDEFAIPPHLMLFGGVLLASLSVAVWGLVAWRSEGWGLRGITRVLRDPALLLAGIGGTATLASAPVDNAWHEAYGRDAVLWSPPHLLAVAGTLALSVGMLAGLRASRGRGAATARLFAAAGVIGALQVPVLEYDSDVPQFSTLWFLPVAALGLCVAVALLDDLLPGRWAPPLAGLVYTCLRLVTLALLATLGFSLTVVPPILLLLVLSGALAERPLALRLVLLGALSPLSWWPFLELQGDITTTVPPAQLPSAMLLGAGAGLLVALIHGDLRITRSMIQGAQAASVLAILVIAIGATPERAWAHDPGQGEQIREGRLAVERSDGQAVLTMAVPGGCDGLRPVRTTARRAGRTLTGTLDAAVSPGGICALTGRVDGLDPGRWFIYAELRSTDGRELEAWLPAKENASVSSIRPLYAPPATRSPAPQQTIGVGLLVVVLGLVAACLHLGRRAAQS